VCARKIHEDEVDIDVDLVRRLLAGQFARWADLPLERFESIGTVNAIYRLGDDMCVRLPLVERWAWHLKAEAKWLPRMRPHLRFELPEPLGKGVPAEGYPFEWGVYRWIEGETWSIDRVRDEQEAALDLVCFLQALQRIDTTGVRPTEDPLATSLAAHDQWIRYSIEQSRDMIDADAVTAAWEAALALPAFDGPYVWVHSDVSPDNLLVRDGRLRAIIDWGSVHVGDAARDVACIWGMFSRETRKVFREALLIDDATWARARAWALRAVGGIHYYRDTIPVRADSAVAALEEVLADINSDG
jgi:aminoglycoside phosphotransferase (APT) family kinase protein